MKDIVIDFAGWCRVKAKDAIFVDVVNKVIITGEKWQKLSEEERNKYSVEMMNAQMDATEYEFASIDISLYDF